MEDKTLNGLTDLLKKATVSAEDTVYSWEGEYCSPELLTTIQKAKQLLQILDETRAIQEG